MRSRRAAFSVIAVVLLTATLGIKARLLDIAAGPDLARYNRELASLLAGQGFDVGIEDRMLDMDLVTARRGDCEIKARAEDTADRYAAFRGFTAHLPVVRYRYRGELRESFPRGLYDIYGLAGRIATRLSLSQSSERPLAIAASAACDLDRIDFGPQQVFAQPG
jgi:hypothetical protein